MPDDTDKSSDANKGNSGGENGAGNDGYIGGGGSGSVKDPSLQKDADVNTLNYEQILFLIAGVGKDLHAILETGANLEGGWLKFVKGGGTDDDTSSAEAKDTTGTLAASYTAFGGHVWFQVNYNDDLFSAWKKAVAETESIMNDLAKGNVGKISAERLRSASRMVGHYQHWLHESAATSASSLHSISSPDSDFQGRAAYAVQGQVKQINYVLGHLYDQLSRQNPAKRLDELADSLAEFGRTMAKAWNDANSSINDADSNLTNSNSVISDSVQDASSRFTKNVSHYIRGIGIVRGQPNYVLDYAASHTTSIGLKKYVNEVMGSYDSWRHDQYVGFEHMGTGTYSYNDSENTYAQTNGHLVWDAPPPLPGGATIHGDLRSANVWGLMNRFISDYVRDTVLKPMEKQARAAAEKLAKAYQNAEPSLKSVLSVTPPTIGNTPGSVPDPDGGDGGGQVPPFDPGGGDGGGQVPPFDPGGGAGGSQVPPFDPGGGDGGGQVPPFDPGGGDGGGQVPPFDPGGGDGGGQVPPFDPGGGDGGGQVPPFVPGGGADGGNHGNLKSRNPGGKSPELEDPFVNDPNGRGGGNLPPLDPFGGRGQGGSNPRDRNDGWSPNDPWDPTNRWNGRNGGGNEGPGGPGSKVKLPGDPDPRDKNDGWSPNDPWDRIKQEIGRDHPGGVGGDLNVPPPGGGAHGPGDVGGDAHFNAPGGGASDDLGGMGNGPGSATNGEPGFAGDGWSDWSGQLGGAGGAGGGSAGGQAPANGSPMMPPMGGGMGGMGGGGMGGGGGGARERERQTWLSEDEEVWGADVEAGGGVIGRPDGGPRVTDDVQVPTHVHAPAKPVAGKKRRDKKDEQTAETAESVEAPEAVNPLEPAESTGPVVSEAPAKPASAESAQGASGAGA